MTGPDCYCEERIGHPDLFDGVPEGYCGLCAYCGKPGHTRAHPRLPTTQAWCDEHWQDQISGRIIGLDQILQPLIVLVLILLPLVAVLWRWIAPWLR